MTCGWATRFLEESSGLAILFLMDRLWTPWRYNYISGEKPQARKGVPEALEGWPGEDADCVFCNLIRSVEWGVGALGVEAAEKAGHVLARLEHCYVCLNAFPYASGHLLIVPYLHTDSLAKLPGDSAGELVKVMQRCETALRTVYKPEGINLGMNLGRGGRGRAWRTTCTCTRLPRWFGDTNFISVLGETRVLPETLDRTWERVRAALRVV